MVSWPAYFSQVSQNTLFGARALARQTDSAALLVRLHGRMEQAEVLQVHTCAVAGTCLWMRPSSLGADPYIMLPSEMLSVEEQSVVGFCTTYFAVLVPHDHAASHPGLCISSLIGTLPYLSSMHIDAVLVLHRGLQQSVPVEYSVWCQCSYAMMLRLCLYNMMSGFKRSNPGLIPPPVMFKEPAICLSCNLVSKVSMLTKLQLNQMADSLNITGGGISRHFGILDEKLHLTMHVTLSS